MPAPAPAPDDKLLCFHFGEARINLQTLELFFAFLRENTDQPALVIRGAMNLRISDLIEDLMAMAEKARGKK